MQGVPFPHVQAPQNLAQQGAGISRYVIFYDYDTNKISHQPPNGWGVNRHFVYYRTIGI